MDRTPPNNPTSPERRREGRAVETGRSAGGNEAEIDSASDSHAALLGKWSADQRNAICGMHTKRQKY
jgi:hypothetical protein